MRTDEYTRKEREAINAGWAWLNRCAEYEGHSAEHALDEAERHEKRDRESHATARATIIGAAMIDPEKPIHSLCGLCRGYQLGAIVGASIQRRNPAQWTEALPKLQAAKDAHDAALERFLASVRNR